MKVLHILNELKHSGAEVMLASAGEQFRKAGIELHVLSTGAERGAYATLLARHGYTVHWLPFRKHPSFLIKLSHLLRRENFDVMHIHTERAHLWYALVATAVGVGRVVRTYHNVRRYGPLVHCIQTVERAIGRVLCGVEGVAIGDTVYHEELTRFRNPSRLIHNWIGTEHFRPPTAEERMDARMRFGFDAEHFVAVVVGSCTTQKRHVDAIGAVATANSAPGEPKVTLLHVGGGPLEDLEGKCVAHYGMAGQVRFAGVLDDVRPALWAADVCVMTSTHEGLGMAALEAMSCGLPVVLYDVPGLRDLVREGQGGWLVEPDAHALASALLKLRGERRLWTVKGMEGREVVLRDHAVAASVEQLVALYRGRT
jgi:glycosyltransferase involved in cell wall biosynthesis